MNTYETIIIREREDGSEEEIPVCVEYTFCPAFRGRHSMIGACCVGPPLEPDEPAYVDIELVRRINQDASLGEEVELFTHEAVKIEDEIMQHIADAAADHAED